MKLRNLMHLALTLLLAAGSGLFAKASQAQSSPTQKPATPKKRSSVHGKKSSARSRRGPRGQKGPTPDRISEIQEALAKDGSFTGKPNGTWDATTVDAMRRFQETHGLNATGKLDAKTLQQLGLGSPVAGAAPPQPSANSSKLTIPPRRAPAGSSFPRVSS